MNLTTDDAKKIPDFLQNATPQTTADNSFVPQTGSLTAKYLILIISSWFLIFFGYIYFLFGWENLSALQPSEFSLFMASAFISLAFLLLLTTIIRRNFLISRQAEMAQKSLERILYAKDENALSKIISHALQKQVTTLTDAAINLSKQTAALKQELNVKAEDFSKAGAVLDDIFSKNLNLLANSAETLIGQCQSAAENAEKSASLFSLKADELKSNAQALNNELNPLINETIVTADHLKNILGDSKNFVAQAKAEALSFQDTSRKNLESLSEILIEQSSKLKKTFLQTADNCESIYKRLDNGISHIENSLKTHKDLAAEQSGLIERNSSYLDNKLGEYGKLISLEVEAMIERSSTLEMNVKKQLATLSSARENIDNILNGANSSLEKKSALAANNIKKIISNLDDELSKLNNFIKKTENKNSEIQTAAEKITSKIGEISLDLGTKVDDLKNRAVEAIDKFNEVSGIVQKNTALLSESASTIVNKGKEGAESLEKQHANINEAVNELDDVKSRIAEIGRALNITAANTMDTITGYKSQISELSQLMDSQINRLEEQKLRSETHLTELKKQYDELSIGNFINESSAMIEVLENMAVDLNNVLNGNDNDDLWKKFYNGDHAVFARNIVKNLNRKQIVKIREEYEKNKDFRELTNRYILNYETLLKAAQKCEKPETVLAMLSGADLGKIYYITAKALDRLG